LRGVRGEKEGWGERNDPNIVCTYEQKKKNKQKKIEEEEKKKKESGIHIQRNNLHFENECTM
jgi:hypothetical protein